MTLCEWCDDGNAAVLIDGEPLIVGFNTVSPRPICRPCWQVVLDVYHARHWRETAGFVE